MDVEVITLPGDGLLNSDSIRDAVENPIGWALPYLPVKREQGDDWPEIGLMFNHPDVKYTVFLLNMYDLDKYHNSLHHIMHSCPQYKYNNVDELEKAGWIVD